MRTRAAVSPVTSRRRAGSETEDVTRREGFVQGARRTVEDPMTTRKWTRVAGALALAVALGSARGADALTLADLDAGDSFAAGTLTFSDFDVVVAGDLSIDLADYAVQVLGDGFRIAGPLTSALGDSGTMIVSYQVSAGGPLIEGASLLAPAVTIGPGSLAWAAEAVLGPALDVLGTLLAFDFGPVSDPDDSLSFAPVSLLSVIKVIHVDSGLVSALPFVEQRFAVVPEPMTLLLLAGGLAGLAIAGRRRVRPA
jgi:hypothetical protein